MSWNYRIGTSIFSYKKVFEDKNEKLAGNPDQRLFSIIEVYYTDDNIPDGYAKVNPLSDWENLKDLKGTHKLIKLALKKPILDLDNFPVEWKTPSEKKSMKGILTGVLNYYLNKDECRRQVFKHD